MARADSVPPPAELAFSRCGLALTGDAKGDATNLHIVSHLCLHGPSQHSSRRGCCE